MDGPESSQTPERPVSLRERLIQLTKSWEQKLNDSAANLRDLSKQDIDDIWRNPTNSLVDTLRRFGANLPKGVASQYIEPLQGVVGFVRGKLEGPGEQQNG